MNTTIAEIREDAAILAGNIAALRLRNPALAGMIEHAEPSTTLQFEATAEPDTITATLGGKALASKRRPTEEARRWADAIDLDEHAVVVVHGFALGYHARALAERCDEHTAILILETDIPLLRAALARIDHARWLRNKEIRFITTPGEVAALASTLRGLEAPLSFGVCFAVHPASASRLAIDIEAFNRAFPAAVAAIRTHIITTLMQSDTTFRNALANADLYANSIGITELKDIARGRLGIVVSAGPSLKRNVELLKDPHTRARCVVVAVQTVLKPLLAMGIRPDFVTAIDYAEISKRFYEGLTADDVRGITLVSTGRANPAIHAAWPGRRRIIEEEILRTALGEELAASPDGLTRGELPNAATVAHLSYSLARYLGCDPVALIGQDLAFTDGQYYADGAAIHTTWGGEINSFNTLEMLEWQRIVRMRNYLHKRQDHLGRPVYTDEQMATYAAQFEELFAADHAAGLLTIDASEGGVAKQHAAILTLAETLHKHAGERSEPIPAIPIPGDHACDQRSRLVRERLAEIRRGVRRIARLSRDTEALIDRIDRHAEDTTRVNNLITQVHRNRDEVHATEPAWTLLQRLNQTAALKRYAADRRIARAAELPEIERFRLRLQRDRINVQWMGEVGDHLDATLEHIDASFDGIPLNKAPGTTPTDSRHTDPSRIAPRVWAILVDTASADQPSAWDTPHNPAAPPPLRMLVERLSRCTRLRGVIVLTDRADEARQLLGDEINALKIRVIDSPAESSPQATATTRARRIARLVARSNWRGGLANLSVFDEPFDAPRIVAALQSSNAIDTIDAAIIAGIDWCFLDPTIVDRLIEQHEESPEQFGIVFTQAIPGLSPVLMSRPNLEEFAKGQANNTPWSNLGGTLGYIPVQPRPDPIGRINCVPLEGLVRDAGVRLIPDGTRARQTVAATVQTLGNAAIDADADTIAGVAAHAPITTPAEIAIAAGPPTQIDGESAGWYPRAADPFNHISAVTPEALDAVLASLGQATRDIVLTIGLTGWRGWARLCPQDAHRPADPLGTDHWRELVAVARRHHIGAIHLRTDLNRPGDAQQLIDAGIDIISIDAWANDAALYQRLTGIDAMRAVFENTQQLLQHRRVERGLPTPWIVPRITRCDATYETIEAFYDKWLMLAGAAAIDPLPAPIPGQRIAPLTLPDFVDQRLCSERMVMLSGTHIARDDAAIAHAPSPSGAVEQWAALVRARRQSTETQTHTPTSNAPRTEAA